MQETPEQTLANAKRSVAVQRDGGTHRPGPRSIGKGSAGLKMKSLLKRVRNIALAVVAIPQDAGEARQVLARLHEPAPPAPPSDPARLPRISVIVPLYREREIAAAKSIRLAIL